VVSYVVALPEVVSAAATDVASIGSQVATANQAVAGATTRVLAAAEDEVSAAIAAVFSAHGQGFQALSAQATAFHAEFVQALTGAAGAYTAAEAANASPLGSTEKALLGAEHEIQQIPTTLATGFSNELNFLLTAPSSPLLAQFTGNNPLFGLFLGNTPPKLLPLLLGETVQHTTFEGMSVVQITPAHPSGDYVVAIHGGAFIFAPSLFHWVNYAVTAYQTGATFEVPIYPLLQQGGTAAPVVAKMADLISSQIIAHGASHVSVIGDSSGGNLALAATESLVSNGKAVPSSLVLLSPWLDLQSTGGLIGREWAAGLPLTDYRVSPGFGSPQQLAGLPHTYVYTGTADSLEPSAIALRQAAIADGVGDKLSYVVAPGQIHDWVLLAPWGSQLWPQIDQELGIAP
jgi:triacylglycerol lipase